MWQFGLLTTFSSILRSQSLPNLHHCLLRSVAPYPPSLPPLANFFPQTPVRFVFLPQLAYWHLTTSITSNSSILNRATASATQASTPIITHNAQIRYAAVSERFFDVSPKMKQPPIEELVYGYMFPKARPSDPPNFSVFLQRHLIYEVRQEVHSYYGHIDTQEAKYPGLDYNHPIHRIRLSRWTWHRRLFRAFDALRLTEWEIANLTKWEGTRWAKEKYEEEQGITIRDTTADGFPDLTYLRDRVRIEPESSSELYREAAPEAVKEDEDEIMNEDGDKATSDEGGIDSALTVPPAFSGHQSIVSNNVLAALSDEEWLKIAIETGQLPRHSDITSSELSAPRILAAAREGRWHEVPTIYRDVLQSRMGTHFGPLFGNPQLRTMHLQYGTTAEPARRTTSELRLATATNFSQRVARPGV